MIAVTTQKSDHKDVEAGIQETSTGVLKRRREVGTDPSKGFDNVPAIRSDGHEIHLQNEACGVLALTGVGNTGEEFPLINGNPVTLALRFRSMFAVNAGQKIHQ